LETFSRHDVLYDDGPVRLSWGKVVLE